MESFDDHESIPFTDHVCDHFKKKKKGSCMWCCWLSLIQGLTVEFWVRDLHLTGVWDNYIPWLSQNMPLKPAYSLVGLVNLSKLSLMIPCGGGVQNAGVPMWPGCTVSMVVMRAHWCMEFEDLLKIVKGCHGCEWKRDEFRDFHAYHVLRSPKEGEAGEAC